MKLFRFVALVVTALVVQTGCGGGNNNSTPAVTASTYYMSNGACYQTGGSVVATSYCNTTLTTAYGAPYATGYGTPVAGICNGRMLFCPNGLINGPYSCERIICHGFFDDCKNMPALYTPYPYLQPAVCL